MKKKTSEKRMYVLVPYNLSDIQKGIQAAHAMQEYGFKEMSKTVDYVNKLIYIDWVKNWKTIIIYGGGTTGKASSMESYMKDLDKLGVNYSVFHEPDLNDALTAIAFVLDLEEDSHVVGYLKQMSLA